MSAHCYIQLSDVPKPLIDCSSQRVDSVTGAKLIAFKDCPLVGEIEESDGVYEVEFPFPRAMIRDDLVSWFMQWGISFSVVM
jgi:hypothetical protein